MACGKNIQSKLAWGQGVTPKLADAEAAAQIDFDQDKANLMKELKDWAKGYVCRGRCRRKINGGIHEDLIQKTWHFARKGGSDVIVYDIKQGLRAEVYCEEVPLKKTKGKIPGWNRKKRLGPKKKNALKQTKAAKKRKGTKKTKGKIPGFGR